MVSGHPVGLEPIPHPPFLLSNFHPRILPCCLLQWWFILIVNWTDFGIPRRHSSGHVHDRVSPGPWLKGEDSLWTWGAPWYGLGSQTTKPLYPESSYAHLISEGKQGWAWVSCVLQTFFFFWKVCVWVECQHSLLSASWSAKTGSPAHQQLCCVFPMLASALLSSTPK